MYLISACLLGNNCKYDGGNNESRWVVEFAKKHSYMPVCPEVSGGMTTPRHPSEIVEDGGAFKVVNNIGEDVTDYFEKGADGIIQAAEIAAMVRGERIEGAILKQYSPSCGSGEIYDGTFTRTIVPGDGVFVRRLRELGIPVWHERCEVQPD